MSTATLSAFQHAFREFSLSSLNSQILRTIPDVITRPPPTTSLFVFDSSFNPPTQAHLRIATSALMSSTSRGPQRLLLLLAIKNADKTPQPASFAERLHMMALFAEDLHASFTSLKGRNELTVDIGVTKLPYFVDKAEDIASVKQYKPQDGQKGPLEQIHLVGFDTLLRIFDTKYYPPNHTLAPLQPLFDHHRLRATYRVGDKWGGREDQAAYLENLRDGGREKEGGRKEWADRIELVEREAEGQESVSSTKVRGAAEKGDVELVRNMCTEKVAQYVNGGSQYTREGIKEGMAVD